MSKKKIPMVENPVKLCKDEEKIIESKKKNDEKKLRKFSREFFLILEAKLKKFLQTGPIMIPESVPVWLLVDKGFSCECF